MAQPPAQDGVWLAGQLQAALVSLQQGRLDEAERLLDAVLRRHPAQADALQLKGAVARRRGDNETAVSWFNRALAVRRDQPAVWNNLGNALSDLGRSVEAVTAYRQAVALKPDFVDAWINLGIALIEVGDEEEALAALARAERLVARPPVRLLLARARALKALERLDEARTTLERALKLAPEDLRVRNNLANLLREMGAGVEALTHYRAAEALAADRDRLRIAQAGALVEAGRAEEGMALLREILAARPDRADAAEELSDILAAYGRGEEIAPLFEELVARAPQALGLWSAYLRALVLAGRLKEAEAVAGRAEAACGAQPLLALWRGRILEEAGAAEEALSVLRPELAGEPSVPASTLWVTRARCHLRLGRYREGAAELEPHVAAQPEDYAVLGHLEALWRLGGDARAQWLLDYDHFVRPLPLETPPGYENFAAFQAALAPCLERLHITRAQPLAQTLRGGTQTLGNLLLRAEPEIRALKWAIARTVERYIADLPEGDGRHPFLRLRPRAVRFAGSWSVRLADRGFHVTHYHPAGWLSSALYVRLPEVVREDDPARQGWIHFGVPPVPVPEGGEAVRWICPQEGLLALFPSFCWHGTAPFSAPTPRMTVAFDVRRSG
ncbi:MAG: tetratricopeptide repeat-containing 2OG-Fe(II) oxygenase [Rhodothalassiaceae bacterium]|nr:MAG: tetratricopeptide repeat-containing 2OG-Fe(II) oxygenase [Rhodothalassiaceae bacterium]